MRETYFTFADLGRGFAISCATLADLDEAERRLNVGTGVTCHAGFSVKDAIDRISIERTIRSLGYEAGWANISETVK